MALGGFVWGKVWVERTGWECRLDRDLRSRGRGGGLVGVILVDVVLGLWGDGLGDFIWISGWMFS